MLVHQDASTHRWVAHAAWDLVLTPDDATGEHTSMFLCEQEGTASSFHGIGQTIARYGLFASLYSDRGSHYFTTPEAGGKVDKLNVTEVGRALRQLGIEHIAVYSPGARGRSERAFQTHQGRLPQELARAGIPDMDSANRYLEPVCRSAHKREFCVPSTLAGTAFVPFLSPLADADAKKALSGPVSAQGVAFTDAALDEIVHVTRGYAYSRRNGDTSHGTWPSNHP